MAKAKKRKSTMEYRIPLLPSGFIFMCDRSTMAECFGSQVFGLPLKKIESVVRIQPGTALFLFDHELKILHGVYRATSHGGANLVPHAFDGKFQAQVKFQIDRDCYPLPESVFRHAIQENYCKAKFRPELDCHQVHRLLSLFQNATASRQPLPPVDSLYAHRTGDMAPRLPPPVDFRFALQTARLPTSTNPRCHPLAAPPPAPNAQYYPAPPNISYCSPPPPPPPPREQYHAAPINYHAAPPFAPSSNAHCHAAHPYCLAQPVPQQLNDQYYAANPYHPAQPQLPPPKYQHALAPPSYPAQLQPSSHQYHPAPPNYPPNQGGSTQSYHPENVVPN